MKKRRSKKVKKPKHNWMWGEHRMNFKGNDKSEKDCIRIKYDFKKRRRI